MKNKIILITGGTSGIGKQLVKQLHTTNQIIVCSRNQQKISECQKLFKNVHFMQADISDFESMIGVKNTITETYGYLDALFNNAGIAGMVDLNSNSSLSNFNDMSVNFNGTVHTTSIFTPLLQRSQEKPTIVITSSILAKIPHYEMPLYSASKAALHSYCLSLRAKMKTFHIVEVLPPLVNTPMTESIESGDKMSPETVASTIISGINNGKNEIYPGIARLANVMSRLSFKRISKIINKN